MAALDLTVSAIAEYASSEESDSTGQFTYRFGRKSSSKEFANLFRSACDELKQESGNTHQARGFVPTVGGGLLGLQLTRSYF